MASGKTASTVLALLMAFATIGASFVLVVLAALELSRHVFEKPGDLSSGDSAGWAFVISLPILLPLDLMISITAGVIAYRVSFARLRRPSISTNDFSN